MKTISRKDVAEIYKVVCSAWQTRIDRILSEQKFSETITVDDNLITEGYKEADAKQKGIIGKYFDVPKNICDRIQTIQDVLDIVGERYEDVIRYKNPTTKEQRAENARNLIERITKAYNEGYVFDWTNSGQYKWFPYFRKDAPGLWVLDSVDFGYADAFMGFGCYFKSKETATDAVTKFIDIYRDYLPE